MTKRLYLCEVCDLDELPTKEARYTKEERKAHIQEAHTGWATCKGCDELISQGEYIAGKGWCDLCELLCNDCMDKEKYPDG